MTTLEQLYRLEKHEVELKRVETKSGKWLEVFPNPKLPWGEKYPDEEIINWEGIYKVEIEFPEFTCLCPRTSQPDFATVTLAYIPKEWCVELKSLKYYLNSFRNEGHFHEEVCVLIERDLREALDPVRLTIIGEFNVRGGMSPTITVGDDI